MTRRAVVGTTYLIHFDRPYRHARHYTGWASDLDARIAAHLNGEGARLMAVVNEAGITWHVSRTWPGTTRATERKIKNTRHVPEYCPDCAPQRNAARRQARKNATARKDTTMHSTEDRGFWTAAAAQAAADPAQFAELAKHAPKTASSIRLVLARDAHAAAVDEAVSDHERGDCTQHDHEAGA
jgi:predicted GIY-YIG superfamily endonuclease